MKMKLGTFQFYLWIHKRHSRLIFEFSGLKKVYWSIALTFQENAYLDYHDNLRPYKYTNFFNHVKPFLHTFLHETPNLFHNYLLSPAIVLPFLKSHLSTFLLFSLSCFWHALRSLSIPQWFHTNSVSPHSHFWAFENNIMKKINILCQTAILAILFPCIRDDSSRIGRWWPHRCATKKNWWSFLFEL